MPTLENNMIGNPTQSNIGDIPNNIHYRTQADIIGSDPTCEGEGPKKDYQTIRTQPIDRTGQPIFRLR